MNPDIIIYTDGSSRGNPGPGGYGIVMIQPKSNYIKEFSCGYKKTTNNRNGAFGSYCSIRKN